MNNQSTTPFTSSSETKSSGLKVGRAGLVAIFVGVVSIYLLTASILRKIGLEITELYAMVILVPVAVYLIVAFTNRISGSWGQEDQEQFTQAGGSVEPWTNAMAGAAEWVSLLFLVTLISTLSMTNHDGIAIIAGIFCGLTITSVLIIPKVTDQHPLTLSGIITSSSENTGIARHFLQLMAATIIIVCSMAFLITQVEAGSHLINLYFPIGHLWASTLLLAPVVITIVFGGMRGLTIANMLLIWLIGAALLVPLIWLSIDITGTPIPQLSYGKGALQPILQLEEQLVQINSGEYGEEFEQGNFTQYFGFASFLASVICVMAATSVMPQLHSRLSCSSGVSDRIRTTGWMLLIIALLVSALPALIIFMKFEIYHDLIGLPLNRLHNSIGWLLNWANTDNGQLAKICGQPAVNLQAIIMACGNDPEYTLIPSDIDLNPLVLLLGVSEITGMPVIMSALSFIGLYSASTTTAAISMMVIVNSINEYLVIFKQKDTENPADNQTDNPNSYVQGIPVIKQSATPVARHLFISRLLLIAIAACSIWLSGSLAIPGINLSQWALLLLASAVFPAIVLMLWWKPTTQTGAAAGIVSALAAGILLIIQMEFGTDWVHHNGNEHVWMMPYGDEPVKLINAAIMIIPFTFGIIFAVSIAEKFISKLRLNHKQTQQASEEE